ncbi:hypothetical protein ABT390_13605 [Streptomyces aurantiacus]|uniref:Uncharacterized protein n=1 Tax=Streptomyces aurantiacus JA 4570 TaxID=1286094 RepID=S3ZPQ6_9ACTN|nr:hypothetical protein [Streptomyces aurantiacus]EPH40350.1 hypothetical protein STRAU_6613 [Streptomyces aurantiacus JA 4570]
MTPAAARATIAAHLTDELDVPPHLATLTAASLADRLAIEGWEITSTTQPRPVAPRARETSRARRLAAHLTRRARADRSGLRRPHASGTRGACPPHCATCTALNEGDAR